MAQRRYEYQQALAWFEAEQQVLLAAITLAAEFGYGRRAWQLPWVMTPFLHARRHYQEWATTQRTALAAAIRLGDTAGQATSSRLLGAACAELGDHEQAHTHLTHSLDLSRSLGNRLGETSAHRQRHVGATRQPK